MKQHLTPTLLVAAALTLALLLSAATRTGSTSAQSPARPTSTRVATPVASTSVPTVLADHRLNHAPLHILSPRPTRATCFRLFGDNSDSHGELGACLHRAR
jgi:hypothetical protein